MRFKWILFYLAIKFLFLKSASGSCNSTPATTELHKFKNNILKRRIRSLVFPNKAQLLLTPAFTKAVLDGRPRGLSYSVEFDMYSPLPDTIEGWKPTILVNKLKQEVATSKPLKATHRLINENFTSFKEEANENDFQYDYYNFPFHEEANSFNSEWTPNTMAYSHRDFRRQSNDFTGFSSNFHKLPYSRKKYKRSGQFSSYLNKVIAKQVSSFADQFGHEYQNDFERKQIHEQLEVIGRIFKFNMKKCIRRVICELNSKFKSYGESVMQDVIRLVLIPSLGSDKQSERADVINVNCKNQFSKYCPYSILDFLNKSFP